MDKPIGSVVHYGSNKDLAQWEWKEMDDSKVILSNENVLSMKTWVTPNTHNFAPTLAMDPGTANVGMAAITSQSIWAYYFKLNREGDDPETMMFELAKYLGRSYNYTAFAVEGPAFGKVASQILLEGVRSSFRMGLYQQLHVMVDTIAPDKVRKKVLGGARKSKKLGISSFHPSELWPTINPNTADAVAVALAVAGYKWKED